MILNSYKCLLIFYLEEPLIQAGPWVTTAFIYSPTLHVKTVQVAEKKQRGTTGVAVFPPVPKKRTHLLKFLLSG